VEGGGETLGAAEEEEEEIEVRRGGVKPQIRSIYIK
jgi:hypothetical protein